MLSAQEETLAPTLLSIWEAALQSPLPAPPAAYAVLSTSAPLQPTLPAKLGLEKRVEAALHALLLLLASLMRSEAACHAAMGADVAQEANPFQQQAFKEVSGPALRPLTDAREGCVPAISCLRKIVSRGALS